MHPGAQIGRMLLPQRGVHKLTCVAEASSMHMPANLRPLPRVQHFNSLVADMLSCHHANTCWSLPASDTLIINLKALKRLKV